MKDFGIAIIGLGTVGTGTARILLDNAELIAARAGRKLVLRKAVDLDESRAKAIGLAPGVFTTRFDEALADPGVDAVVELIGGIEPAKGFMLRAMGAGKHLVTANKKLLALHWGEIFAAAAAAGVEVGFEASVGGGIPIIRALREGLAANRIRSIYGIINGTSNYILSEMTEQGVDFATALQGAQARGYAEADPTLDVGGGDAAHKICILSSLAYGFRVPPEAVYTEGITAITPLDIAYARELGYKIKLLGIAKESDGRIQVRVHPTMIPAGQLLATVDGAYNAIFVKGDAVGNTLYYGLGAGSMPTGSAVVGDLISLALRSSQGAVVPSAPAVPFAEPAAGRLMPIEEVVTPCYVRLAALDRPGVLSTVSGILGLHGISIQSVIQKGRHDTGPVTIIMMTHAALERDVRAALDQIGSLDVIPEPPMLIRVEENY